MTGRFENKLVLGTGGTTGIGLATAERFAAEGASVFVTGRRRAELQAAVTVIGDGAVGVQADMSKLTDIDRLYDAVRQRHRQIDVVFANAGGGSTLPFGAITEEQYADTVHLRRVCGRRPCGQARGLRQPLLRGDPATPPGSGRTGFGDR